MQFLTHDPQLVKIRIVLLGLSKLWPAQTGERVDRKNRKHVRLPLLARLMTAESLDLVQLAAGVQEMVSELVEHGEQHPITTQAGMQHDVMFSVEVDPIRERLSVTDNANVLSRTNFIKVSFVCRMLS